MKNINKNSDLKLEESSFGVGVGVGGLGSRSGKPFEFVITIVISSIKLIPLFLYY